MVVNTICIEMRRNDDLESTFQQFSGKFQPDLMGEFR